MRAEDSIDALAIFAEYLVFRTTLFDARGRNPHNWVHEIELCDETPKWARDMFSNLPDDAVEILEDWACDDLQNRR